MACTTTPIFTTGHDEVDIISYVHCDIIKHNILSRLDGLSLCSLNCTSSYFNVLSSEDSLWREMCTSTWPSIKHPRVQQLITAVPNGHRRLFSDSFPLLTPHDQPRNLNRQTVPSELISAVDIWYKNKLIFSRVIETKTKSDEFLNSRFRVNFLDPKEVLPTRVKVGQGDDDDAWLSLSKLEKNLTVSWIIYDPISKRSANFSSTRPISLGRHWLPDTYYVSYTTILGCERGGYEECKLVVTCGALDSGELHVREVCLRIEDMDGTYLNGRNGLVSLMNAIAFGKRKPRGEKEGEKMHEEYLRKKRWRWEKRGLIESAFGIAGLVGVVSVAVTPIYLIIRGFM